MAYLLSKRKRRKRNLNTCPLCGCFWESISSPSVLRAFSSIILSLSRFTLLHRVSSIWFGPNQHYFFKSMHHPNSLMNLMIRYQSEVNRPANLAFYLKKSLSLKINRYFFHHHSTLRDDKRRVSDMQSVEKIK